MKTKEIDYYDAFNLFCEFYGGLSKLPGEVHHYCGSYAICQKEAIDDISLTKLIKKANDKNLKVVLKNAGFRLRIIISERGIYEHKSNI